MQTDGRIDTNKEDSSRFCNVAKGRNKKYRKERSSNRHRVEDYADGVFRGLAQLLSLFLHKQCSNPTSHFIPLSITSAAAK
jgi:hypothetical protein